MTTRITGLATGLDVDTIVKQTMQAYRTKIDTQQQKKDVTEIKQQLYRDLIKEAQELYNTHFDVLKSGSLIRQSTWQSVKFESDNPNLLTVTGDASAILGNYTVDKESVIAKAAYIIKPKLDEKITINGQSFNIKQGVSEREQAIDLNNQLTKAGIDVSVKYTGFVGDKDGGFLFESKTLGANSNFVIGTGEAETVTKIGEDAKGAKITGLIVSDLKSNIDTTFNSELGDDNSMGKVIFKIGSDEFTIDISSTTGNEDLEKILNTALSKKGYTAKIEEDNIIFTTTQTGSGITNPNTIQVKNGDSDNYIDITNFKFTDGIDAKLPKDLSIGDLEGIDKIYVNGVYINLKNIPPRAEDNKITIDDKINYINKALEGNKISSVIASKGVDGNIVLKSNVAGGNSKIEFCDLSGLEMSTGGKDAKITISNGTGTFIHEGNSNTFTVDGITFKFTGDIPADGIKVSSKQDSTEIIDKIKSYIDDYNKLIVKINTLISEKRDRNYQPLTKDQKAEMSDKEIELWEAKVKQGQLKNDSDLTRLANSLRQGMSTMVSGSGLTLKDIGIESVQDYGGTKDGTFKIKDEAILKEAIENNTEAVSKLFIQSAPSETSENDAYSKKGIMMRLKDILYDETVSSKSVLAKKVGFEGTTTVANNTLTKQMTEYQKKIDEMEKLFSTKEQDLYTKYAKLETIMNSYNSQMTYLSQSLGLSS